MTAQQNSAPAGQAGAAPAHGPLLAKDARHALHPWADLSTLGKQDALVITGAQGVEVVDSRGRRYIDAIGGMWCVTVGYGREELVEAMAAQARRMPYFTPFGDVANELTIELGAQLAALAPGDLNRVHFTTGGSTAVDSAVRIAHLYHAAMGLAPRSTTCCPGSTPTTAAPTWPPRCPARRPTGSASTTRTGGCTTWRAPATTRTTPRCPPTTASPG